MYPFGQSDRDLVSIFQQTGHLSKEKNYLQIYTGNELSTSSHMTHIMNKKVNEYRVVKQSGRGVRLNTHLHPVPMLRTCDAIPLFARTSCRAQRKLQILLFLQGVSVTALLNAAADTGCPCGCWRSVRLTL
jgi:hypothetical protein